jgi:phosphoesterase RecJ-like protein
LRRAADLLEHGFDHASLVATMLVERRWEALQLAAEVFRTCERACDGQLAFGRVPLSEHDRLGLVPGDLEGLVDSLVHIAGVHVACLVIDRPGGGVKLSLRSRSQIDVAAIAEALAPSGGGHAKAAGVLLDGDADVLDATVRSRVAELVAKAAG